jgi:hypothetical protein
VLVLMAVSAVALVILVALVLWYVVTRGRHAGLVTRRDFDAAYDDVPPADREAAWRDFHGWQLGNEAHQRSWDEPDEA